MVHLLNDFPLWSAQFGLKLLDKVILKPNAKVLDIGCGMGFPTFELAMRFGSESKIFGIDPWLEGIEFAKEKAIHLDTKNVSFLKQYAENLSFEDLFFDTVVSNIGLNNVQNFEIACLECGRVAKKGAQLVFTMPTEDMFAEFYEIFKSVLSSLDLNDTYLQIEENRKAKLRSFDNIQKALNASGFKIKEREENVFYLTFVDGAAFLNHQFIKQVFYPVWLNMIGVKQQNEVFEKLEIKINSIAEATNGFKLTVPFSIYDCVKI